MENFKEDLRDNIKVILFFYIIQIVVAGLYYTAGHFIVFYQIDWLSDMLATLMLFLRIFLHGSMIIFGISAVFNISRKNIFNIFISVLFCLSSFATYQIMEGLYNSLSV